MEAQEIAKKYLAMISSVNLINEMIASGETDEETVEFMGGNIEHLENMITQDYWTNEDMTSVNQAITDGTTYLGGN